MPFPNFHAARLRNADLFKEGSFRTVERFSRDFGGRRYLVVRGRLKSDDRFQDQSFRYPVEVWTESLARRHAREHGATNFEPAEPAESRQSARTPEEHLRR